MLSDNGTCHKCLHRTVGQHFEIVLLLVISVGLGLGTATAQAQIRAYVANADTNTVSVVDTASNTVLATIPVGPIPFAPIGIAITPDGTRVYVTNAGDTVSLTNTTDNTIYADTR